MKQGLLTIELPIAAVERLWALSEGESRADITVDLGARQVSAPGATWDFALDDFTRWRLMEGLDDIGLTLLHAGAIADFEARRPAFAPAVA